MYTLINNKKYKIITMNKFIKRLKGIMFKKESIKTINIFTQCSSIHIYYMKQKIDECILDKNFYITYLEENVKPRKIIIKKGYYTLEMPLNTAKKLKLGNKIKINDKP